MYLKRMTLHLRYQDRTWSSAESLVRKVQENRRHGPASTSVVFHHRPWQLVAPTALESVQLICMSFQVVER